MTVEQFHSLKVGDLIRISDPHNHGLFKEYLGVFCVVRIEYEKVFLNLPYGASVNTTYFTADSMVAEHAEILE